MASRPATLPAAVVPVVVGAGAALSTGAAFRPLVFLATLLSALCIQVGTNFANDYSDFHRGADHEGRLGPTRVTQSGLLTSAAVRAGIIVAFGAAALLGAGLVFVGGWPIVLIGIASIICGLAYTGGPWPFGYHGLGDLFVFVFFGPVAVVGTAFLQTGAWSPLALAASVPIGLLVTNILVINNLRDLPTDRDAGKRTLATRIGDRATRAQYALFALAAFLVPVALSPTSPARRWLLLPLLSAPLALALVRVVLGGLAGRALNPMLGRTGRLLVVFGALFAIGLVLAGRA
ncbi:MAG: 1,4-dihydroxy-2-naphthoateoctaprenyltransferase [Gemmatimonadetes bacterium]|jgi:1,4-dihydroxy-2-naphthoate octaprenyltransferase|nr:1,4-dihydroxy-2-naphthoateoctaprenyltransferase [Gemmatimonadota bacterium]